MLETLGLVCSCLLILWTGEVADGVFVLAALSVAESVIHHAAVR